MSPDLVQMQKLRYLLIPSCSLWKQQLTRQTSENLPLHEQWLFQTPYNYVETVLTLLQCCPTIWAFPLLH